MFKENPLLFLLTSFHAECRALKTPIKMTSVSYGAKKTADIMKSFRNKSLMYFRNIIRNI